MELTDKEITQISSDKQVYKVEFQECFRCGLRNHHPDKCFHKESECHTCKKMGHISPKCPQRSSAKSSASNKPKPGKKKNSRIKFVDTRDSSSESEVLVSSYNIMLSVPPQPTIFRLSLSFPLSPVISIFPVYFLSLILYSFPSLKIRKFFY